MANEPTSTERTVVPVDKSWKATVLSKEAEMR